MKIDYDSLEAPQKPMGYTDWTLAMRMLSRDMLDLPPAYAEDAHQATLDRLRCSAPTGGDDALADWADGEWYRVARSFTDRMTGAVARPDGLWDGPAGPVALMNNGPEDDRAGWATLAGHGPLTAFVMHYRPVPDRMLEVRP